MVIFNRTPSIDCIWVGAVPNPEPYTEIKVAPKPALLGQLAFFMAPGSSRHVSLFFVCVSVLSPSLSLSSLLGRGA